MGFDNIIAFHI